MRALLVGAGGMGKAWARNLRANSNCSLVGWVDLREGAAAIAAQELEIPDTATGQHMAEVADRCAPDFVVDVSSPDAHHQVTLAALDLGLPVLGEKPMAVNLSQASEMVEASLRTGRLYMVSQSRRYDAGLVALRGAIRNHLGSLGILNADFYIGAHFGGFRDEMDSPLLLDMAIHTFDGARFLSDADPVTVIAEEFNPAWSWYRGASCATASFEMADGLRFSYRGSWCAEGLPTSWDGDWRAVGKNGSAQWIRNGAVELETIDPHSEGFERKATRVTVDQPAVEGGIAGSLAEFLSALKTGVPPQGRCEDNIKSLAMVFAAVEASRSGRRTRVTW